MADESEQKPETEIEVKGSYHRYYGEDHYGDRPEGDRTVPEELWRVLRVWDRASTTAAPPPRSAPLRAFLGAAAAATLAVLLYDIFW